MDRSQHTFSSLDELKQIQFDARRAARVDELRHYFDRVQELRRAHVDDFETQLLVSEVQEEIIERARSLRNEPAASAAVYFEENPQAHLVRRTASPAKPQEQDTPAEIAPEVPRVDTKTWQRATYLALFFTLIIFAAFFYLVQTARKINLTPNEVAAQKKQAPPANPTSASPQSQQPENPATAPVSANPALRLYTDLVPGTISIDGGDPQDLKDGELVLDNLQPGRHSIQVNGRNGTAAFSFDVAEKSAPRIVGLPTASNAMAVLVSQQDGKGRLVTNAGNSQVSLDGQLVGELGADGLILDNLGSADHNFQVVQDKDRQRFVLTYTPAPTLTAYVKSDPNAGTVVVMAGQDGADVYVNDALYRRKTDHGQLRIPLKVGEYTIRVHKTGFIDPPPENVNVKKAEESPVQFHMVPVPQFATLAIKGALPGTMVYIDKEFAAMIGADGIANLSNVKPGDHVVELQRDQALPKRFQRTFQTGEVVTLAPPDVDLERAIVQPQAPPLPATATTATPNYTMEMDGSQVRRGGGFVTYHVPKVAGHYTFSAQGRIGGVFKHNKLTWYAGYQDPENYILFTLDGKHASIRDVRDGRATEISRVPFNIGSNEWVQAYVSVSPDAVSARVRTPDSEWTDIGSAAGLGRNLTQGKVGFYIPSNDEVAVSNFRFSNR